MSRHYSSNACNWRRQLSSLFVPLVFVFALSDAAQYSSNMFLNGQYQNGIAQGKGAALSSVNPAVASNIFLEHAIISRQAAPFMGPTYLPPKCSAGEQCVKKSQCKNGIFTQSLPAIEVCNAETDICCRYRPPPPPPTTARPTTTTTTTTQRPYATCGRDSDCVSPRDCQNGEIANSNYVKKQTPNRCYEPEVCCRLPSTTLTDDGYVLRVPQNPLTTPPTQRPPAQPRVPIPDQLTPDSSNPSTVYYNTTPRPTVANEYLPPVTTPAYRPPVTQRVTTPRPAPTTTYAPPPPPPPTPTPPRRQPPVYTPPAPTTQRTTPDRGYLPPQTPTQTPTRYTPPAQPQPQPTPTRYTPPAQPQPTPPRYTPERPTRPTATPRQPTPERPRPQPRPTPPAPRPTPGYLPPDRVPQPSNENTNTVIPPRRGESVLSPQIFPPAPIGAPQKCASALLCTPENYCNAIGVISETPVEITPFRVPLLDCTIEDSGAPGKCCRDPNYVDPWPVNVAGVCAQRNKNTKPQGIKDIDSNFAEIPWQAMVLQESTKTLLCGGTILGDVFVLTTASCVKDVAVPDVRIKAGEWELGSTKEPLPFQLVGAKSIDVHPSYDPATGAFDMAMIRLDKRFEFATNVQPICISDKDPEPSEQCVTSGWGKQALRIHEEGAIMHRTQTSVKSRNECGAGSDSVCLSTSFDACEFDSGSALACGSSSVVLKGIYSVENACGEGQTVRFIKPDVKWINQAFAERSKPLLLLKRV